MDVSMYRRIVLNCTALLKSIDQNMIEKVIVLS